MSPKTGKPNRQVQRTKSWIFEAIMLLMDEKPYSKITVSDITEKAGIARQTFYRNYNDKDDVVFEYMMNTFNAEMMNIETTKRKDEQNTIVFIFDHKYMVKNQKILKKILSVADIKNRIFHDMQEYPMSLIKHYRGKLSAEEYLIGRYKLCYQITGFLSLFFDWFINGMPMPVEKFISMINAMNIPRAVQYKNIPNIEVRLKKE
ncbi:MAG: TetR/AcrR family transcriptional regulator [Treponema sp.]|jgi:AcrR family transcriptional regulator|nr:TetR/AcrR family transcriptional regulator [Treponema sp.]